MPVGVDASMFKPVDGIMRKKYSVCMVSRISPIKHIELAISAVRELVLSGTQVSMAIVGSPTEKDFVYDANLKKQVNEQNLASSVNFIDAVSQDKLPEIYSSHEIYLNLTPSGSFDKTIVEAVACGAIPLVSNTSLRSLLPEACITEATPKAIAASIQRLFDAHEQVEIQSKLRDFVASQSLISLMSKLFLEMK